MNNSQKLWRILTLHQRRSAIVLLGLMLIGMVLETLGIALVIPALALMTQSDLVGRYPGLVPWLDVIGNPSHEQLVIGGMLALVGVYAIKAFFLAFLAWRQAHFVFSVQAGLSQRLFAGYLRQPYTFHLQRNSAELIRNTMGQVTDITGVMHQGLALITELLVLIGISLLLLITEPIGALLVVSAIVLSGCVFHWFTRRKLLAWGEARQLHEGQRIKHLQQGLGGAKDVKLLGRESHFLAQYEKHNIGSAKAGQYQVTLKALPRLGIELLAVTGLAILVVGMIAQGKPLSALLPMLGLFAAASFRLLPSVNRVLMAIQGVRFFLPVINTLDSELCLLDMAPAEQRGQSLSFNDMLILNNIRFSYPSAADVSVLQGIDLRIPCGASVGFVGSSGGGKSTLVDIILGLLTPNSGSVKVDGIDIQTNIRGWQDLIGYVPQSIFLTDDTLRRNVAFGLSEEQIDDEAVWGAIRAAQLEQFVNELSQGLDTHVGERGIRLSGGQRQRIGIARALYHDPQVLVLDEASSSLDIATERSFMDSVFALQGDKTIIIVAHRLSTVEHCDRLFRIERGRVVQEGDSSAVLGKEVSLG